MTASDFQDKIVAALSPIVKEAYEAGFMTVGGLEVVARPLCEEHGDYMVKHGTQYRCVKCMSAVVQHYAPKLNLADTEICRDCSGVAIRKGTCYTCTECGSTSSCS